MSSKPLVHAIALSGLLALPACNNSFPAPAQRRQALGEEPICAIPVLQPRVSFTVTDSVILDQFPLQAVLAQVLSQADVGDQTPLQLYQQWWDTQNDSRHGVTIGPHCDDHTTGGVASIDGFRIQCPRQEGVLAATNPFVDGDRDSYVPIGLVNRFDLAPMDGSHCGEYRVVYAKKSGRDGNLLDRNLLIFEAVMPNPTPGCVNACRPIAQFWARLSNVSDIHTRAQLLHDFYFNGLPAEGFPEPVIHPAHYGLLRDGQRMGQIRTNQFMNNRPYLDGAVRRQSWQLREFKFQRLCFPSNNGSSCRLFAQQVTDKTNPFGGLFNNDFTADPRTADFRADFIARQVTLARLATPSGDVNNISMVFPDPLDSHDYNSGESTEPAGGQFSDNDYAAQLAAGGPDNAFLMDINSALAGLSPPSNLSATDIAERATTQSCAGCHQISTTPGPGGPPQLGRSLGNGVRWPFKTEPFVHMIEHDPVENPDGSFTFNISNVVSDVFLPHRVDVLQNYLMDSCNQSCPPPPPNANGATLGGRNTD